MFVTLTRKDTILMHKHSSWKEVIHTKGYLPIFEGVNATPRWIYKSNGNLEIKLLRYV